MQHISACTNRRSVLTFPNQSMHEQAPFTKSYEARQAVGSWSALCRRRSKGAAKPGHTGAQASAGVGHGCSPGSTTALSYYRRFIGSRSSVGPGKPAPQQRRQLSWPRQGLPRHHLPAWAAPAAQVSGPCRPEQQLPWNDDERDGLYRPVHRLASTSLSSPQRQGPHQRDAAGRLSELQRPHFCGLRQASSGWSCSAT